MSSFVSTALIAAPPERVWTVLADVTRWPEWLPTVASVVPLSTRALKPGARFRLLRPERPAAVWTVIDLNPPNCFTWQARRSGVLICAHHVVAPISTAMTIVTLRVTCSGLMAGFAALLAGRRTQTDLAQKATALKRRVESMSEREYRAAWLRTTHAR